jgi:hypothetical protein
MPFTIFAEPTTAPPAGLPYGGPDDITALIVGSGGGFQFGSRRVGPLWQSPVYRWSNLKIATRAPGGDHTAIITMHFANTFTLPTLGSRVEIADLRGIFWVGLVDKIHCRYWGSATKRGADVSIVCAGWASTTADLIYGAHQVFAAGTTTVGGLFRHARDHLCPDISGTNAFIAATAELGLPRDTRNFRGDPAIAVWGFAASLGSTYATNDELIWLVRAPKTPGYPAGVPILEIYALPDAPSYTIDLAGGYQIDTEWDRQQVRNRIAVSYGSGTGDVLHEVASINQVAEAASVLGWAQLNFRERQMWIDSSADWQDDAYLAQHLADATLAKYGTIHSSGETVTIPSPRTLRVGAGPATIPVWRAQAGYVLDVDNLPSGIPANRTRLITGTLFDLHAASVQLTTGTLNDAKMQRSMTGVVTKREKGKVPPLARPNAPEEWEVDTIVFEMDTNDVPAWIPTKFPHTIREIEINCNVQGSRLPGAGTNATVEVGVGTSETWPTAETILPPEVFTTPRELRTGYTRHVDIGQFYLFRFTTTDATPVRVSVAIHVLRLKVYGS